jgi:enamine deaminase RidA (YjgF/YER057c/UK114 family)
MERHRISSGGTYEQIFGYCRAVRVGQHIYVAGTAPAMRDGADPPADSYGQASRCFEIIGAALAEAGAGFEHVVRTRMYLTPKADLTRSAVRRRLFRDIRPVNTTVIIAALIDPRWHLEIKFDAVISETFESSVLDHRFGSGDPYTLGVEEEYMLLDAVRSTSCSIDTVLRPSRE